MRADLGLVGLKPKKPGQICVSARPLTYQSCYKPRELPSEDTNQSCNCAKVPYAGTAWGWHRDADDNNCSLHPFKTANEWFRSSSILANVA